MREKREETAGKVLKDKVIETAAFKNVLTTNKVQKSNKRAKEQIINQYRILQQLGKGSFGVVKLCQHTITGEKYAMKIVKKKQVKKQFGSRYSSKDEIQKEVDAMKKVPLLFF